MGTWGSGNFDSDSAMDIVDSLQSRWHRTIEKTLRDGRLDVAEGIVMPLVALMVSIEPMAPPEASVVADWRRRYIALFDAQIRTLDPAPGYAKQRRAAIVKTFDALAAKVDALRRGKLPTRPAHNPRSGRSRPILPGRGRPKRPGRPR